MADELLVSSEGAVRVITLNRPEALNAINEVTHRALLQVWRDLDRDDDARCVVLTGAGRAFSAGGDLAFIKAQQLSLALRTSILDEAGAILRTMLNFRLPVIAAINGPAVGLGVSLALSCDIVIMAENSFLADPHVSIGLTAGDGGAFLWPHMTSMLRAREFLYTGDRIPAPVAVELGLANRVVPAGEALSTAMELAQRLAQQPARALQTTKRALAMHMQPTSAVIEYGGAAELMEMGGEEHIARIRELFGAETYDAI